MMCRILIVIDPTQKPWTKSYRLYGSHPAAWTVIDHTDQELKEYSVWLVGKWHRAQMLDMAGKTSDVVVHRAKK